VGVRERERERERETQRKKEGTERESPERDPKMVEEKVL